MTIHKHKWTLSYTTSLRTCIIVELIFIIFGLISSWHTLWLKLYIKFIIPAIGFKNNRVFVRQNNLCELSYNLQGSNLSAQPKILPYNIQGLRITISHKIPVSYIYTPYWCLNRIPIQRRQTQNNLRNISNEYGISSS